MPDKRFIQRFLRLNGIDSKTASDKEVRDCLARAQWSATDIEEAVNIMRGKAPSIAEVKQKAQMTFRPEMDWSSDQISKMLGVDVVIDPKTVQIEQNFKKGAVEGGKKLMWILVVVLFSLVVAFSIAILLMYIFDVGPFHQPAADII